MIIVSGDCMKKNLIIALMIFNLSFLSSCSTYNSIVPNWMEIGSSETVVKEVKVEDESDWSWWNPFSWF